MRHLLVRAAIAAVVLLLPTWASACSCVETDDITGSFRGSTVVVAAEAVTVSRRTSPTQRSGRDFQVPTETVEWMVVESWKGAYSVDEHFETRTAVQGGLCGRSVAEGDVLILYLYGQAPFQVSICSRTGQLKDSLKDVPVLYRLKAQDQDGT